jgi:NAD kinase
MSRPAPRVVLVSRTTEYEELLRRHSTRAQAAFFLQSRGQDLREVDAQHACQLQCIQRVLAAIPSTFRRSRVDRRDLSRFVFEPEDVVVAVGQDGLVANVAKSLRTQWVIGINPDAQRYAGVLARHRAQDAAELLHAAAARTATTEARTLVEVRLDDGQRLLALNEVFLGHRSHQSARYALHIGVQSERQSSSGAIVTTGTGATGWARSIAAQRSDAPALPAPTERALTYFVREAFPSARTFTSLTQGRLVEGEHLALVSEMNEGGVVFGDGIEEDRLELGFGVRARVGLAEEHLTLVV